MAFPTVKNFFMSCFVPVALSLACTTMPAKAPGSNPGDMTPEGHRQASTEEAREAEKHQSEAERVQPSKPAVENAQRENHERQGERHQTYSDQHEDAARAAESNPSK
jgi:hypothetical protein